jgi:hypothetical protein
MVLFLLGEATISPCLILSLLFEKSSLPDQKTTRISFSIVLKGF